MHRIDPALLEKRVEVLVIGCGGTGSAIAAGLPYLHQAMLALGHPGGLSVTLVDDDVVSQANCVRQAFSQSDVGLPKATVLATRINAFWGLDWSAEVARVGPSFALGSWDLIVSCVDSRAARSEIQRFIQQRPGTRYWLDIGNKSADGQFVLGQPWSVYRHGVRRLPTVAEMYPEILDASLDDDGLPSCSALEAITRQEPFVNQVLANQALALLARLFRWGQTMYHGGFVNLETGRMTSLPCPGPDLTPEDKAEIAQLRASGACTDDVLAEMYDLYPHELRALVA